MRREIPANRSGNKFKKKRLFQASSHKLLTRHTKKHSVATADLVMMLDDGDQIQTEGLSSF